MAADAAADLVEAAGERPPGERRLPYRVSNQTMGKFTFDADFDSGNCARVESVGTSDEFHVWTAADCAGTHIATEAKTWWHFSVRGGSSGGWITITVHNMNGQSRLYKSDFRPVYRNGASGGWQRIRMPVVVRGSKEENNFRITFRHRFDCAAGEPTFFAFSYPWSYAESQAMLDDLEARFGATCPAAEPDADARAGGADAFDTLAARAGDVYFRRELLATSLEGRRIDVLTITSAKGGLRAEREPPIGSHAAIAFERGGTDAPAAGGAANGAHRWAPPSPPPPPPHAFGARPVFVISARVHPGEVPASHVLNGFLEFALRADDVRARALRECFVLKVIPCLNPDGVFHGHYRLDTLGVNLNRCYARPDARAHPAIYATRALLEQLHARGVLDTVIDLHGHATKRGCFLFGNSLPDAREQVEAVLFAKLVALNSQAVDFDGCVFSQANMSRADRRDGLSKEGASRVAIYRLTGVTHCYTLECNYNMGRSLNRLAEPTAAAGRPFSPPPIAPGSVAPKYTPETWAEVGRALALAALDLRDKNPRSRLQPVSGGSRVEAVRGWCATYVRVLSNRQPIAPSGDDYAADGASGGDEDAPPDGARAATGIDAAAGTIGGTGADVGARDADLGVPSRKAAGAALPVRIGRAKSSSAVLKGSGARTLARAAQPPGGATHADAAATENRARARKFSGALAPARALLEPACRPSVQGARPDGGGAGTPRERARAFAGAPPAGAARPARAHSFSVVGTAASKGALSAAAAATTAATAQLRVARAVPAKR